VAIRQEAEGRRQEGRKKDARNKGIITVYPKLILFLICQKTFRTLGHLRNDNLPKNLL